MGSQWPDDDSIQDTAFDTAVAAPARMTGSKVVAMPPLGQYGMMSYLIKDLKDMPLRGIYQMRARSLLVLLSMNSSPIADEIAVQESSPTDVKFQLQLKLGASLSSSAFEYLDITVPFFNRYFLARMPPVALHGAWH